MIHKEWIEGERKKPDFHQFGFKDMTSRVESQDHKMDDETAPKKRRLTRKSSVDGASEKIEELLSSEENQQEMNLEERSTRPKNNLVVGNQFSARVSQKYPRVATYPGPTASIPSNPEEEIFVIKKEHASSNGKDEELTIHKQQAVCRYCYILIEKDSHVFNVQCECTKISLIHDYCKDPWFQAQGPTCSNCDKQKDCARVVVSSQISGDKPSTPTPKWPWRRFQNKGKK